MMKTRSIGLLALALAFLFGDAGNSFAADSNVTVSASSTATATVVCNVPAPEGATVLWNGRDLTGWTFHLSDTNINPADVWSVHDGALRITGKPNGYLRSEQAFSNYVLHVEWRWLATNGNSGVLVHINGPDKVWPESVEAQLRSGSAGEVIGLGTDFDGPVINNRKRAKIAQSSEHPVGEWNAYDIVCQANTMKVSVNGVPKNQVEQMSVTSGSVGLQSEGAPIEFRNVWVKPL